MYAWVQALSIPPSSVLGLLSVLLVSTIVAKTYVKCLLKHKFSSKSVKFSVVIVSI